MGLFDWFKRRVTGSVLQGFSIGNPEVYSPIDNTKAISEGYNANTAVYSIVNKDAQKFASIPMYVYKRKGDESEEQENDLSKLLNRPNEYQGQDSFRQLVRTYYKLTGEVFIWLNRGDLGDLTGEQRLKKPVFETYVLPSDNVLLIPDPTNMWGIAGYILVVNGKRITLPKEDVIHWKQPSLAPIDNSLEHLRGRSPLASGYKTLQQNNDATAAAVRMYQNDGAKGVLYSEIVSDFSPEQKNQLDTVINKKLNNSDVKGAVARLAGKWGYLDLGKSNTDLGLLEGKNISLKELCFLFDVPFELFDSQTTFANKEQAQKGWLTNSIIPSCKQFDDELNRVLLKAFNLDSTYYIGSDWSDLPELQDDYSKLVNSLAQAWWMTPNEKREWMGEEPIPGFDECLIPTGLQPVSMLGESMDTIANDLTNQGLNDSNA